MKGKDPERDRREIQAAERAKTMAPALKKMKSMSMSIFDMMGGMKSVPSMKTAS